MKPFYLQLLLIIKKQIMHIKELSKMLVSNRNPMYVHTYTCLHGYTYMYIYMHIIVVCQQHVLDKYYNIILDIPDKLYHH